MEYSTGQFQSTEYLRPVWTYYLRQVKMMTKNIASQNDLAYFLDIASKAASCRVFYSLILCFERLKIMFLKWWKKKTFHHLTTHNTQQIEVLKFKKIKSSKNYGSNCCACKKIRQEFHSPCQKVLRTQIFFLKYCYCNLHYFPLHGFNQIYQIFITTGQAYYRVSHREMSENKWFRGFFQAVRMIQTLLHYSLVIQIL